MYEKPTIQAMNFEIAQCCCSPCNDNAPPQLPRVGASVGGEGNVSAIAGPVNISIGANGTIDVSGPAGFRGGASIDVSWQGILNALGVGDYCILSC